MKIRPLCAACTLMTRARELELLELNLSEALAVFRSIAESAGVYLGPDIEFAIMATATFRRLKSMLEVGDIYAKMKEKLLPLVKEAFETIEQAFKRIEDDRERFVYALKTSAAGNALDLARPFLEPRVLDAETIRHIELKRSEAVELYDLISSRVVSRIVYVFDGALEVAYDYFLIRELKRIGAEVVGIVKSERYEDDAVPDDLREFGLLGLLDDVVETGTDTSSVVEDEVRDDVKRLLQEADAVIAKGALNYLTIRNSGLAHRLYVIMRVPCKTLAYELGVPLGSYVAARVPETAPA